MPAKQHLKENSVLYGLLAILTGAGGVATLTDNLPVTQGEYQLHLAQYEQASEELEDIKKGLEAITRQQLRDALRQAYVDKCRATDAQAITYINAEIEDLQAAYVDLVGRRFEPPPCEVAE